MRATPKGLRLHIGLFGRRNVGKSSLLNAITRQSVSIVSDTAGTTTDPVEKPMELLPIGPVLFIDTAGIDDVGALGEQRVEKTHQAFNRTELAVLVTECGQWNEFEDKLIAYFDELKIPFIVVMNKSDVSAADSDRVEQLRKSKVHVIIAAAASGEGISDFREALIRSVPDEFITPASILGDLVPAGEAAMLVVPIDKEAPKGRLIMPQVQSIRDLLDNDAWCLVVKERELREALDRLKKPPALVVTDSQAFLKVAGDTPNEIPMTSFSILFARFKGDLVAFTQGAMAIEKLKPGDKVLVAESCSHHPIGEDIGRVKIPRWLTQYVGGKLEFIHVQGHDFPEDLSPYKLAIHCGACTQNRREVLSRIEHARQQKVPITNYGMTIAWSLGIFERALAPFPAAMDEFRRGLS